jgi:hypothetical protein
MGGCSVINLHQKGVGTLFEIEVYYFLVRSSLSPDIVCQDLFSIKPGLYAVIAAEIDRQCCCL